MIFCSDDGFHGYEDIFDYVKYSEVLERLIKNIDYYVWCKNLEMSEKEKKECEDYIIAKKQIPEDIDEVTSELESFVLGALEGDRYLGFDNCPVIDIYNNKFSFNHPDAKEDELIKECRKIVNTWYENLRKY